MRIHLKSNDELRLMRSAGLVAAEILDEMCVAAKPGVSTWDLDQIARAGIARHAKAVETEVFELARAITKLAKAGTPDPGELDKLTETYAGLRALARPDVGGAQVDRVIQDEIARHRVISAFLGYAQPPYPAVVCTSINHIIVHGIPNKAHILAEGDIIGIDFGIFKHGYCADTARTVMIGKVSDAKRTLVETAEQALEAAIKLCTPGNRLGDLGHAVQSISESRGFSVVRQFVGHGTGRQMHEDPQVPNFTESGRPGTGKRMKTGLVIAVEPMVNAGAPEVEVLDDDWTAVTKDRSMSAHFEHTIAVTDQGPWVLTRPTSTPGNP